MTIFVTAYADKLPEAVQLNAIDILLKPVASSRFSQAIQKAQAMYHLKQQEETLNYLPETDKVILKRIDSLTPLQFKVFQKIAEEKTSKQIA